MWDHDAWEERDHEGYKYYVHKITGQSEWAHATDHHDAFDQDAWDEEEHDGHKYYVHRVTGQSMWADDHEGIEMGGMGGSANNPMRHGDI